MNQSADSLSSEKALDYYLNGSIQEEAGEITQAAVQYQLAHLYDPTSTEIIKALSNVYKLLGESDAAAEILEKGWIANPADENLVRATIRICLRKKKFEIALLIYSSIVERRDLTEYELGTKAAVLTRMNRLDESLQSYQKLLTDFKPTAKVYDKIAQIHVLREDVLSAEAALAKRIELDSSNDKVFYVLGGFSVARKDWERAEDYFRKAIQLDSLQIPYWRNLFRAIVPQGDLEKQLSAARAALNIFPTTPQFQEILAGTLMEMGKFEEALKLADMSIQIDSTRFTPHSTKGSIYFRQEKWDLSAKSYEKALRINPESAMILNNYAYLLAIQNVNLEEAMTMSEKATEIEPENPSFLDTKGWLLYRLNKYDEALGQILLALEYGSENAIILDHLAAIYEALGNEKLAEKARARAIELEVNNDK